MSYLLSLITITLLITEVHAESLKSKITSIVKSDGYHPHLLLMENGLVVKVRPDEKSFASLEDYPSSQSVKVTFDQDRFLKSITAIEPQLLETERSNKSFPHKAAAYTPTNLPDLTAAQVIFKNMDRNFQRSSQCYNRAHIWAFEEFKRSGLQSMKMFMFYTKRYIWDYDFDWWFHVSPMTYVKNQAMVLDRMFMKGPATIKDWSLRFIQSKRDCPVVKKYADYVNNQETEHCYLMPVSMYYWQPYDIENFDRTGYEKTTFLKNQINWAYWEAF